MPSTRPSASRVIDPNLAGTGRIEFEVLDNQRLAVLLADGGFHDGAILNY